MFSAAHRNLMDPSELAILAQQKKVDKIGLHFTTIKFVPGGRFKESELFSELNEFYNLNPVDLQYLATLVRGKVPKTIELQGNSQY